MNYTTGVMNYTAELTPVRAALSMLPCFLFLYVNAVMLASLLLRRELLQSSRYLLFAHLLLTDSLQLLSSMQLYLLAAARTRMASSACAANLVVASFIVKLPPLNLAVMSLERLVAIRLPLRHAQITTRGRTGAAIALTWSLASLDSFAHLLLVLRADGGGGGAFRLRRACNRDAVFGRRVFAVVAAFFDILVFVGVSLVIVATYLLILCAVGQVRRNRKARRTLLLHFLQLCMCLTSILFHMINRPGESSSEPEAARGLQYGLFLALIIFPKSLSPLVYGLRDRHFRPVFRYYFTCGLTPPVKT